MGPTPARLVRSTVGFIPTTELKLGHNIEPSVSVPSVIAAMFADTDIAEPLYLNHKELPIYKVPVPFLSNFV